MRQTPSDNNHHRAWQSRPCETPKFPETANLHMHHKHMARRRPVRPCTRRRSGCHRTIESSKLGDRHTRHADSAEMQFRFGMHHIAYGAIRSVGAYVVQVHGRGHNTADGRRTTDDRPPFRPGRWRPGRDHHSGGRRQKEAKGSKMCIYSASTTTVSRPCEREKGGGETK